MPKFSGYAYKLQSRKAWDAAPDDDWEEGIVEASGGRLLGKRYIDGVMVSVYRVKGAGTIAVMSHMVQRNPKKSQLEQVSGSLGSRFMMDSMIVAFLESGNARGTKTTEIADHFGVRPSEYAEFVSYLERMKDDGLLKSRMVFGEPMYRSARMKIPKLTVRRYRR